MSILIHGKMPTNGEVIVIKPNGQAILYARGDVAFIDDPKRIYKTIELPPPEYNKKKTQADKIIAEGAKGLAELFAMACPPGASCTDRDIDCNTCIMNWLLSEVDE